MLSVIKKEQLDINYKDLFKQNTNGYNKIEDTDVLSWECCNLYRAQSYSFQSNKLTQTEESSDCQATPQLPVNHIKNKQVVLYRMKHRLKQYYMKFI